MALAGCVRNRTASRVRSTLVSRREDMAKLLVGQNQGLQGESCLSSLGQSASLPVAWQAWEYVKLNY